jgi:hypothetical protein
LVPNSSKKACRNSELSSDNGLLSFTSAITCWMTDFVASSMCRFDAWTGAPPDTQPDNLYLWAAWGELRMMIWKTAAFGSGSDTDSPAGMRPRIWIQPGPAENVSTTRISDETKELI